MTAKDQRPKTKNKFEHSAGGIVYRKVDDRVEVLLLQDQNGNWSFPKGLIEKDEESAKTAEREIEEEVGLKNPQFIDTIDSIRYFYRFRGEFIRKKVDYHLFEYQGNANPKPQKEEGIRQVKWFEQEKALKILGYAKTNKPILEKALEIIRRLAASG